MLFLGDDWAEDHHDVELVDEHGKRLARKRLPEGLDGIARLHALIAEHMPAEWADLDPVQAAARVRVGIETDHGPWVQALLVAGYHVFAINPLSVARYRERHSTSGAKSDQGDAHVLAEIVRLDHAHHRQIAGDSVQAEAVKLVARTHQVLIWERTRHLLRLRSALREFYPAALNAFDDLTAADTLELLARAPDPTRAARLSRSQITAALHRANRRNIEVKAAALQQQLRADQLRQPAPVQSAYAAIVTTQVRLITALNTEIERLGQVAAEHFGRHRDADYYLSLPGLAVILGARILGEFGDDPHRFTDAKSRKNYAGTSPITRASGTRKVVLARYARNRRLGDAVQQWAFCAMKGSPGARTYYNLLRKRGTGHQAALRQLGNRLVGIL
ncbi:IS110 family transposase, partial [Actinoplanes aureus]